MKIQLFKGSRPNDSSRYVAVLIAFTAVVALCGGCAMFGGPNPKPVTVPQVLVMTKSGTSDSEIIRQMKASGTVYRLKASQLADLKQQGVASEVIDYMQQTYLDAVRRDASYEDWRYWNLSDDYWYGGVPYDWPYDRVYTIREQPEHKPFGREERSNKR